MRFRDDISGQGNGETTVLELYLEHETDDALKVALDEESKQVWLAKSLVHITHIDGSKVTLICPVWLAEERGLV